VGGYGAWAWEVLRGKGKGYTHGIGMGLIFINTENLHHKRLDCDYFTELPPVALETTDQRARPMKDLSN
jgi:hypothetical protein